MTNLEFLKDGITIITGCDTDVGKTVATAVCARWLRDHDVTTAVIKPAQTGVTPDEPADLAQVSQLAEISTDDLYEFVRLPEPLAPTTAGKRCGAVMPTATEIASRIAEISTRYQAVLVEGAGGVLVGLDGEGHTLLDVAVALRSFTDRPVRFVVVAHPGLGTLNHTMLTCREISRAGVEIGGIIFGSWPTDPDLACRCNAEEIADLTSVALLASIPANIGADPDALQNYVRTL